MYNQAVTWSDTKWTYAPVKYWPGLVDGTNYGRVTFFAWSAGTGATLSGNTLPGTPTLTYTVPDANASQKDLVTGMLVDKTASGDVKFTFKHVLSRIGFAARLAEQYPAATVKVTSLKVKYAANTVESKATYTFGDGDDADGTWTFPTAGNVYMSHAGDEVVNAAGETLDNDATPQTTPLNDAGKYLMLLPQSVNDDELTVEMAYTITTGGQPVNYTTAIPLPAVTWGQDETITYMFILTLNEVTFAGVTVNPWGTPETINRRPVTYKANGGTGNDVKDGFWEDLSPVADVPDHFTPPLATDIFFGWNTQTDGNGDWYLPGETLSYDRNDLILYAQWVDFSDGIMNYAYTGARQYFIVPKDGEYQLEAWGARGGNTSAGGFLGGPGGYATGVIDLKKGQKIYVYVGAAGADANTAARSWNGGGGAPGTGEWSCTEYARPGGGATDFRLLNGEWSHATSLNSRIMVAGAGGGAGAGYWKNNGKPRNGGYAGGLNGESIYMSEGGKQDKGGTTTTSVTMNNPFHAEGVAMNPGTFGSGGNANVDVYNDAGIRINSYVSGGGGGYYGGSAGACGPFGYWGGPGGGGSSFISGMTGCIAINPTSTANPRAQDTGANTTALNYNTALFGGSPTWADGGEITFTGCSMVDGAGDMPNPGGGTMTGNSNPGYARITKK
jgi:hypothetical protein